VCREELRIGVKETTKDSTVGHEVEDVDVGRASRQRTRRQEKESSASEATWTTVGFVGCLNPRR
jgi:hypothetical protein